MLSIRQLSFTFDGSSSPLFSAVNLDYYPGEVSLILGATGSGKSTFLRCLNSLAPSHTGGTIAGSIQIEGTDAISRQPSQLSHLVGLVQQQAEASFVAQTVAEELAFGMEQLGVPLTEMQFKVSEVASALGIENLLGSEVATLSGGQQQRVAIGAAIAAGAKLLLMDEPTSELDEVAAGEMVAWISELARLSGVTVLVAEHRPRQFMNVASSITSMTGGAITKYQLGDGLGLTDAGAEYPVREPASNSEVLLTAREMTACYEGTAAIEVEHLELLSGEILGVSGPNGAGKSSLIWALVGVLSRDGMVALADGTDPVSLDAKRLMNEIAVIPQTASDLLVETTVGMELKLADSGLGARGGVTGDGIFRSLVGEFDPQMHPRDLSLGQQLALVLAIQLAKGARVLLLDEPTRGLDRSARIALAGLLAALAGEGKAILVTSHDREFLEAVSHRILHLDNGKLASAL